MNQKIAITHDYMFQFGGAEKVIETLLEVFPKADLYTTVFYPEKFKTSPAITKAWVDGRIKTTWVQAFRKPIEKYFKHLFWLHAINAFFTKVTGYPQVIISSTFCGKYFKTDKNSQVFCYCNTPPRFLYGLTSEDDYQSLNGLLKLGLKALVLPLRLLDKIAANRLRGDNVQWFGNSSHIQKVVKDIYDLENEVFFPPVEVDKFKGLEVGDQKYFIYFGRISFHKRLDILIKACARLGLPLKIVGASALESEMIELKNLAKLEAEKNNQDSDLIEFLGRLDDDEMLKTISHSRAFLFAGKEDFGIAPVEALAAGLPIIMYQAGGALDFVEEGENGIFFKEQTVDSLSQALIKFQEIEPKLDLQGISNTAKKFSKQAFVNRFIDLLELPKDFRGVVIRGKQEGRQIGFPTVNLELEKANKPRLGVYFCQITMPSKHVFWGAGYIGNRDILEANIFDFNEDLYGQELSIKLIHFIRPDMQFKSLEEARIQIQKDVKACQGLVL